MVRYLSWLLLIICISIPLTAWAEETSLVSDCGLQQTDIISGDGTLCKEDIAFGILFEMFPSVFREIGPLWGLTTFSKLGGGFEDQDLLGQYHGDAVFVTLYSLFHKLVILCALTYVLFLALDILSRMIRGKSLSEDSPDKDNDKSWALGGSVGIIFMIPYKNFFVGPIIAFSFAIGALSIANFAFSIFLSSQQDFIKESVEVDRSTVHLENNNVIERHDYIANNYYRYLVSMSLCRRESAAMVVTRSLGTAANADELKSWHGCAYGKEDHFKLWGQKEKDINPSFIRVYESSLKTPLMGKTLLNEASSVEFRGEWLDSPQCSSVSKLSPGYYCGSILIGEPDWASNPLISLLDSPQELIQSLEALSSSIGPNTSSEDVTRIVYDHWMSFYEKVRKKLLQNIERIKAEDGADFLRTEIVSRQKSAAAQAILDQNGHAFRQLARFYHQSAQNMIAFGRTTSYRDLSGDRTLKRLAGSGQQMNALMHHLKIADKIADKIQQAQCLDQTFTLGQAKKLANFLGGGTNVAPDDAHARCVNISTNSVIELNDTVASMAEPERATYAIERFKVIEAEITKEWNDAIPKYAAQRRAVENSFKRYIQEREMGNWLQKMRQEGYLSVAGFTFHMTGRIESIKREIKLITNHFEIRNPAYDNRYLGEGLHEISPEGGPFSPYIAGDQLLNKVTGTNKAVDPYVDRYFWLVQQAMILRQPSITRDNDWGFSKVMENMSLPVTHLKRLGMDIHDSKDWKKCPENPADCPFPLTDPLLELSLMGHDMVDTGIAFYTLAIGMKGIGSLAKQSSKVDFKGTITRSRSSGALKGGGGTASLLKDLGGLAELMFTIMGTVLLVYIAAGALLAYLLPLLPYIYIYMGFITWAMVVVMASFSIMLWSFFWVRFKEKRELLREAGFHYGVDMLFKPLFNLLSVIFAWSLFYMLMFMIGATSSWISILPLSGDGAFGLRAILDPLFILLFIGLIFAMALKFSYQVMDEMSGELLSKLGVKNKAVKDSVGTFIKAMLYDKVMEKGQQMNQRLSRDPEKQKQRQQAFDNMAAIKQAQRAAQSQPEPQAKKE